MFQAEVVPLRLRRGPSRPRPPPSPSARPAASSSATDHSVDRVLPVRGQPGAACQLRARPGHAPRQGQQQQGDERHDAVPEVHGPGGDVRRNGGGAGSPVGVVQVINDVLLLLLLLLTDY